VTAPTAATEPPRAERWTTVVLTLVGAVAFAALVRPRALLGIALLAVAFVPLERMFALRPQRVFRRGLLTDLTHLLANTTVVTLVSIALVVIGALPLIWLRASTSRACSRPGWRSRSRSRS
jgi:hypothetical protein